MTVWIAEVDEADPTTPQRFVVFESDPGPDAPVQQFASLAQAAVALIGPECGDDVDPSSDIWQRRLMERMKGRFLPASSLA